MSGDSLQPVFAADDYSVTAGLAQALAQAGRRSKSLAVLSVGLLDGAATGLDGNSRSRLETALLHATRKGDIVARNGGGEYTLIFSDMAEAVDAAIVASRVRNLFPFYLDGERSVPAAIGMSLFPDDGATYDALLAQARAAMESARSLDTHFAMSPRIESGLVGQYIGLAEHLGEMVYTGAVEVFFQPKLDLATGKITGNEALARLSVHGQQINPLVFITLAERLGYVGMLGEAVLARACEQTRRWREAGIPLTVSVNVSPYQLHGDPGNVAASLAEIIEFTELPAGLVHLELTETPHHIPSRDLRQYIMAFYNFGIAGVAIDDVLTGSSTLDHVIDLPFTEAKFDRGFVLAAEPDNDYGKVARALAQLTHNLSPIRGRRRTITAEGVTTAKYDFMRDIGCDQAQGFDICKPLPVAAYDQFIQERRDLFN